MPKQTHLPILLFFVFILMPTTGFTAKSIQTAQHIIMLDPGHGGAQTGLVSSGGLKEKNITLKLAKKSARKLESQYNVLLTRTGDIDVSAKERISLANQKKADLFISIHLNHSSTPAAFFYYFGLPDVLYNPKKEISGTWVSRSLRHKPLARQAAKQFAQIFSSRNPDIKTYIKEIPTILLEGAGMPALLIEPLSISDLPSHPVKLENALDTYAQIFKDCIDHYFNNQ